MNDGRSRYSSNDDSVQIKAEPKAEDRQRRRYFYLDVRTPEEHKAWKISYDK
jgi:hypothetical protein